MKRPLVVAVIGYIIGIIIGLYFKFSIVLFYINFIPIGVVIHFINKRKKRKFRLFSIRRYFRYIKIYLNHKIILVIILLSIISNSIVLYKNKKYNSVYKLPEKIEVEAGKAIDPKVLKERLDADVNKEIKIVTLTHNETATGVTNPLKELVALIKEHGAVSVVDGVTSVGAIECKMDEWGIDVLISGSQKGFMIPPGLAFLAASEKAFKMHEQCKHPSFYFDWSAYRKSVRANSTPYTPAVNLIVALNEALKMMKKDGLENILNRHAKHAKALRAAIKGLKPMVEDDAIASNAITSIYPPQGISVPDIRSTLKKDFDIVVANGQNDLKDKIFRMGTLGFVCDRDVLAAVSSLEASLYKLGYKFELGSGVKAAIENLV